MPVTRSFGFAGRWPISQWFCSRLQKVILSHSGRFTFVFWGY